MKIHQENFLRETNYCSVLWKEFTTMTQEEFENYKQILKTIGANTQNVRKATNRNY